MSRFCNRFGYMSFHCYEYYSELTSLYIKREFQNQGIGESLICHFENKLRPSTPALVKVLPVFTGSHF